MAPPSFSGTRGAPAYFAIQALTLVAWWGALLAVPALRAPFLPPGADEADLLAFLLPDAATCALSTLAALGLWRGARWGVPFSWAAAGAMVYATAYVVAWAALRDGAWLAVVLMVPAATLAAFFALDASPEWLSVFRRARPRSPRAHVTMTFVWIALFWSFFLGILPSLIAWIERRLGLVRYHLPASPWPEASLLLAASALGLWSGVTMARAGDGTPLPLDETNRLVVAGPYRHVRNPMVVAGLAQSLAVVLWLGSWLGLAYVALGGALWQWFVRPAEERDLADRFGAEYEAYRRRVGLWWPRRQQP